MRSGGLEALRSRTSRIRCRSPARRVVRVEAAGVNFIDVYHRTGLYKVPLPLTLGQEGAGIVEAVGSERDERGARRPRRVG